MHIFLIMKNANKKLKVIQDSNKIKASAYLIKVTEQNLDAGLPRILIIGPCFKKKNVLGGACHISPY